MANNRRLGRLSANITLNGQKQMISNVTTPTSDSDAANKLYVDGQSSGVLHDYQPIFSTDTDLSYSVDTTVAVGELYRESNANNLSLIHISEPTRPY